MKIIFISQNHFFFTSLKKKIKSYHKIILHKKVKITKSRNHLWKKCWMISYQQISDFVISWYQITKIIYKLLIWCSWWYDDLESQVTLVYYCVLHVFISIPLKLCVHAHSGVGFWSSKCKLTLFELFCWLKFY